MTYGLFDFESAIDVHGRVLAQQLRVLIAVFLLFTNWKLALCVLAPMPAVILISAITWKPVSQMFYRVGQKWARFHMHLNESLSGMKPNATASS